VVGTPITFQRALNRIAGRVDKNIGASRRFPDKKIVGPWNKKPLLPRRHSYEPSRLRHCREATKLTPRCLIDVATT
jgi:hypothetical protein